MFIVHNDTIRGRNALVSLVTDIRGDDIMATPESTKIMKKKKKKNREKEKNPDDIMAATQTQVMTPPPVPSTTPTHHKHGGKEKRVLRCRRSRCR